MPSFDPNVTVAMLARGLVETHEQAVADGAAIQQDASMQPHLRRALALVSGMCIAAGVPDIGASVHVAMDRACEPLDAWCLPPFEAPFRLADVVLIDRELGIPTSDCRELAALGGSEAAAQEEIHHESLRAVVSAFPMRQRDAIYTAIREFVVRHPVVAYVDREKFVLDGGLIPAAREIASFYRAIPQAALFNGVARLCGHCGGLLWPHRDIKTYPDGYCRIRQCQQAHPEPLRGDDVSAPLDWHAATPAALNFWVGPGLDEIRIYDAIRAAGRGATLYPYSDAADVGVGGTDIGIDMKSYASPVLLASKLTRSIGRLVMFRRRILAVPDNKLRVNRRYLEQLRDNYRGEHTLDFMTASHAIKEASR